MFLSACGFKPNFGLRVISREGEVPFYREGPSCGVAPTPVGTPAFPFTSSGVRTSIYSSVFTSSFASISKPSLYLSPHIYICLRCFSFLLHALIIALFVFPSDNHSVIYCVLWYNSHLFQVVPWRINPVSSILLSPTPKLYIVHLGLDILKKGKYLVIKSWSHMYNFFFSF